MENVYLSSILAREIAGRTLVLYVLHKQILADRQPTFLANLVSAVMCATKWLELEATSGGSWSCDEEQTMEKCWGELVLLGG